MTTAEIWAERVAAWKRSGQTASEFCAKRDFKPATLTWWSSRLKTTVLGPPPKSKPATPSVRIARVVPAHVLETRATSAPIVVEAGGARVLVPTGADGPTLATVLTVLRSLDGAAR